MTDATLEHHYGVEQLPDGQWAIISGEKVVTVVKSNADAWHWIDRNTRFKPWDMRRKERI
jgi:hypothetical protein